MKWEDLLNAEVSKRGKQTVCRELDIARSSLDLVLSGKYPASTERIEKKVLRTYGNNNPVTCPVLGEISVIACRLNCKNSKRYGNKATGNPITLKLYLTCPDCPNRTI